MKCQAGLKNCTKNLYANCNFSCTLICMKVSKDKTFDLNHHNMGLFDILNFIIIINFDKILAAWRQSPQPLPQNLHLQPV